MSKGDDDNDDTASISFPFFFFLVLRLILFCPFCEAKIPFLSFLFAHEALKEHRESSSGKTRGKERARRERKRARKLECKHAFKIKKTKH